MNIRAANSGDLEILPEIFTRARDFMRSYGNDAQWGNLDEIIKKAENDLLSGNSYAVEENGAVCGVFSLIFGEDPTYGYIEGSWLNDDEYATIHRIASLGTAHGILRKCIEFCEKRAKNIRIDTHDKNVILCHVLESAGFKYCGTIYIADGTARRAYHKVTPLNDE